MLSSDKAAEKILDYDPYLSNFKHELEMRFTNN